VVNKGLATPDLRIAEATFVDAEIPYSLETESDADAGSAG